MLAEECGEVVQLCGKILRHGYDSYHPNDLRKQTNRSLIRGELHDLLAVAYMMENAEDIRPDEMEEIDGAIERKFKFAHHQ